MLIDYTSCQYTKLYYTTDWLPLFTTIDMILMLKTWACPCSILLLQNYRGNTVTVKKNEQRLNSGGGIRNRVQNAGGWAKCFSRCRQLPQKIGCLVVRAWFIIFDNVNVTGCAFYNIESASIS